MFIQTVTDIMYRVKDRIKSYVKLDENDVGNVTVIFKEIDVIKTYVNECLKEIAMIYNSTPKRIVIDTVDTVVLGYYQVLVTVKGPTQKR